MSTNVLLTTIGTIADLLPFIGTITDLLPIIGFIITVVSWRKQSDLNRKNKIAKVRLKNRLELLTKTLGSLKQIRIILTNNKDSPNPPTIQEQKYVVESFISINEDLGILGTKEEQQRWESIKNDFINKKIDSEKLDAFSALLKDVYRRELGL